MNHLVIYSVSLLFLRGLLSAEENRLPYYIGLFKKMRSTKLTLRGQQVTIAL